MTSAKPIKLPPSNANQFERLVHADAAERQRAIEAIRQGLPASILKDAASYFNLPGLRIRLIARVPDTTAHTLVKRGDNIDSAASERVWRMADVTRMAQQVFEDETAAKQWMSTPNHAFNRSAPLDYLDTEPGAMAVRQVLNAIATGGGA